MYRSSTSGDPLRGPNLGTVGTVMCGYFTPNVTLRDGVCWDKYIQGNNTAFSCYGGCSAMQCHDSGMQFVSCADLSCVDANANLVCDSDEGYCDGWGCA